MPGVAINQSAKLTAVYSGVQWPESCQIGMHTGIRDPADYADLLVAWFEIFNHLAFLMPACVGERLAYSEWDTGPGFTGWHQRATLDVNPTFGSGDPEPHQVALAFGWRNVSEVTVPLGRRRNRFYIGPIRGTVVTGDGRLSTGNRTTLFSEMQDLSDELTAIPFTVDGGFQVVSPAAGEAYVAEQFTCGLRFDTMRSRAEHQAESPAFVAIT